MMLINPFNVSPSSTATTILMPLTTASGFTDTVGGHEITVIGSPTISTADSKFGAGALLVSEGNYLRIASTPTLDLSGNVPFTFECWVNRLSALGGFNGDGVLSMRTAAVYCPIVIKTASTYIGTSTLNGFLFLAGTGVALGVWTHYALVGDGTNIKVYKNGVLQSTVAHQSWASANNFLNIGYDTDSSSNAYINDVRVSNTARYTANFTPPSSPFTV